jgi:hypothetical protein
MTAEMLKQLDLSEGTLGQNLLAEDIGHLLDGNALAVLVVGSRASSYNQHVFSEYRPAHSSETP